FPEKYIYHGIGFFNLGVYLPSFMGRYVSFAFVLPYRFSSGFTAVRDFAATDIVTEISSI
ncbi:hypothetical protein KAR10_06140, partial [bacterium]|nr:hypothetical protein [bacterium]